MQYKRTLGQHFLKDQNIVDKLVKYINPSKYDEVIEIGPGDGVMTKSIISKVNKMILIEKDRDLIHNLKSSFREYENSLILNTDILKYNLDNLSNSVK